MQCPSCGSPRAVYLQQAGYKKKPKIKNWVRTDFTAKCTECGFVFNAETGEEIIEKKEEKVVEMPSPEEAKEFVERKEKIPEEDLETAKEIFILYGGGSRET